MRLLLISAALLLLAPTAHAYRICGIGRPSLAQRGLYLHQFTGRHIGWVRRVTPAPVPVLTRLLSQHSELVDAVQVAR